jgi:hypothetical protein
MTNPILCRSNRGLFGILILILSTFCCLTSSNIPSQTQNSDSYFFSSILQTDVMAPTIHNWSHSEIKADEYFSIWANVTDDDSGILNVTAKADVISGDGNDSIFLLEFNGSLYVTNEAILAFNNTYRLWIEAYDNAMNYRLGFGHTIDLVPINPEDIPKDPYLTMPYVIGSSIALLAVIILVSFYYSKIKGHPI